MPAVLPISCADVCRQLRALGVVPGGVLLVHASFRAVRPIDGGPLGLIEALRAALGPEGTLVMPSWTGDDERPFDPATTPAADDLGATADLFWRLPGVVRSDHLQAFAAIGPHAGAIVKTALPLPPHTPASPVGRVHDLDGQVLLLGVGHDANTSLHLAEILAGVPYASRGTVRSGKTGRRCGSTIARTTIVASASRWPTVGCGREVGRPRGRSATAGPGCFGHKMSWG